MESVISRRILKVMRQQPLLLLSLCIIGCGTNDVSQIHGSITYDGQPLPYGAITLSSTDSSTANFGGVVSGGQYEIANIVPGEFKVNIVAGVKHDGAQVESSEYGKVLAENGAPQSAPIHIPANAEGNNQLIQIVAGDHSIDFSLRSPDR